MRPKISRPLAGLLACLLGIAPAFANDSPSTSGAPTADASPPTEASIREMLELTDAHKLLDGMKAPLDAMIDKAMHDALEGKAITPEKQAILDRMRNKMTAVIDELLNWDNMMPMYIKTYQASLTQEELDGMTAFYKTPAGQAVIKKMPLIMQTIMGQMASLMKPLQARMKQIQQETLQEINEANSKPKASTSSLCPAPSNDG
jgi:uncharacterized protein